MDRLLTQEEQNTLANVIDETQFETSVQYWEAILEVITQAQDAKSYEIGFRDGYNKAREEINKCQS